MTEGTPVFGKRIITQWWALMERASCNCPDDIDFYLMTFLISMYSTDQRRRASNHSLVASVEDIGLGRVRNE